MPPSPSNVVFNAVTFGSHVTVKSKVHVPCGASCEWLVVIESNPEITIAFPFPVILVGVTLLILAGTVPTFFITVWNCAPAPGYYRSLHTTVRVFLSPEIVAVVPAASTPTFETTLALSN